MKCQKCGIDNSPSSKFCGNCGAVIATSLMASDPISNITCPNCSASSSAGSVYCGSCGTELVHPPVAWTARTSQPATRKLTSAAWWLMPIFFAWIGGLIAWGVVRESDRSKAKKLLWTGIGLTVFWIILSFALSFAINFLNQP